MLAIGHHRHQSVTTPSPSLATDALQKTLSQLINIMKVTVTSHLQHNENKYVNSLFAEGIHSHFQICKITKIYQDFPQMITNVLLRF